MSVDRNRRTVERFMDAIRAGDVDALDELIAEDYIQHNPDATDGRESAKAFFERVGPVDVDVYRIIADGDLVAVHGHFKTFNVAAVDIYRLDEDGRLAEHWDVIQEVPDTVSDPRRMFGQAG